MAELHQTKRYEAALSIAIKQRPRNCTEFEAAEVMCLFKDSLAYVQLERWCENPPNGITDSNTRAIWKVSAHLMKQIVDLDYDEQSGNWWDLYALEVVRSQSSRESKQRLAASFLLMLMDFILMVRQYREYGASVSQGFEVFADILFGKGWERRFNEITSKRKRRQ
ncbi:MAG: hypothetical protein AB1631_19800 [Acidobacteriota bacterium]